MDSLQVFCFRLPWPCLNANGIVPLLQMMKKVVFFLLILRYCSSLSDAYYHLFICLCVLFLCSRDIIIVRIIILLICRICSDASSPLVLS